MIDRKWKEDILEGVKTKKGVKFATRKRRKEKEAKLRPSTPKKSKPVNLSRDPFAGRGRRRRRQIEIPRL